MKRMWMEWGLCCMCLLITVGGHAIPARPYALYLAPPGVPDDSLPPDPTFRPGFEREYATISSYYQEMCWLTCFDQPDTDEPTKPRSCQLDFTRLGLKLLLVSPFLGKENALSLLMRPHEDMLEAVTRNRAFTLIAGGRFPIAVPDGCVALDLHVHTSYSHDGVADVGQVLHKAARRGLGGVAITDHNTITGAQRAQEIVARMIREGELPADFLVITGEEVSSQQGHILGLFLTHQIPPDMSAAETVAVIHRDGGIAIAAHPCLMPDGVGGLALTQPCDAIETMNCAECMTFAMLPKSTQKTRDAWYATVTAPQTGGSDSHDIASIGFCYTLVTSAPTPDAVRAALRAGHMKPATLLTQAELGEFTDHGILASLYRLHTGVQYAKGRLEARLCDLTHTNAVSISLSFPPGIAFSKRF